MTRRLGAWDCVYCETKRILGNVFDCPGCGHPRPKGVRFYQIPDGPIVTPEIAEQLGSGGPNWYCLHCESGNKDNNDSCWNCGAPRGSSPSHEVRDYLQGEHVPQSTEEADEADPDDQSWVSAPTEEPRVTAAYVPGNYEEDDPDYASYNQGGLLGRVLQPFAQNNTQGDMFKLGGMIAGGIALIALIIFLIYQTFFNTHVETVAISSYNWSQNVVLQEFQVTSDSSWGSHPSDAYNITSEYKDTGRDEKIHDGWKTVSYQDTCYRSESYQDTCTGSRYVSKSCTGTRDNGDGSFTTYSYECGGSESYTYSCTQTRQVPYSCTKTREEELYHYEDIYDTYYEFNVNRWVTINNYPTSGTDHQPYFQSLELQNPYDGVSAPVVGQQQKFEVTGEYSVTFFCADNLKVGEEGYFSRSYSLDEWKLYDADRTYPIEVNFFNGIVSYPVP